MRITKSQKEAVLSLLKEKFTEKQQEVRDKFISEHKDMIDNEVQSILKLQNEALGLIKRLKEIYKVTHNRQNENTLEGEICIEGVRPSCYCFEEGSSGLYKTYNEEDLLNQVYVKQIEEPKYNLVARELELATLNKDFDLNGFLHKYLPE